MQVERSEGRGSAERRTGQSRNKQRMHCTHDAKTQESIKKGEMSRLSDALLSALAPPAHLGDVCSRVAR